MEEENQSEMENAPIESGESGESSKNVSDESAVHKGGRPKCHFDPDDLFNPTFGPFIEAFMSMNIFVKRLWHGYDHGQKLCEK